MSADKSYKELESELQKLLSRVENADYDELELLRADYEKGIEIIGQLENRLATAKNKINKIKLKEI